MSPCKAIKISKLEVIAYKTLSSSLSGSSFEFNTLKLTYLFEIIILIKILQCNSKWPILNSVLDKFEQLKSLLCFNSSGSTLT